MLLVDRIGKRLCFCGARSTATASLRGLDKIKIARVCSFIVTFRGILRLSLNSCHGVSLHHCRYDRQHPTSCPLCDQEYGVCSESLEWSSLDRGFLLPRYVSLLVPVRIYSSSKFDLLGGCMTLYIFYVQYLSGYLCYLFKLGSSVACSCRRPMAPHALTLASMARGVGVGSRF